MNRKFGFIVLIFVFLLPLNAMANFVYHYGVVEGRLKGFSRLGQYCKNSGGVDCTAAKYKESAYNVYQPLREMKVRVYINNRVSGEGSTNTLGDYQISWGYAADASTNFAPPYIMRIEVRLEHKEGRFQVWDADGTPHNFWGTTSNIMGGTTTSNPQELGTWYWGTANSPKPTMQLYEAAWRTWYYAFRHTNRLANHYNNLKVIYDPAVAASVFDGDEFKVTMRYPDAYSIISHELGHAASYKASNGQSYRFSNKYCYPSTASTGCTIGQKGHGLYSDEWASTQFEEGLASFLGSTSAYWSQNSQPMVCGGNRAYLPCKTFDSETGYLETSGPYQSGSSTSRREIDVARYLRDLYDSYSSNESSDTTNLNLYHIVDSVNDFTNSNGNGGKNEPWISATQTDDLDGRSAKDFQHYVDIVGNISSTQSQQLYQMNSNPHGAY